MPRSQAPPNTMPLFDNTFLPPLAIALSGEALEWLTVFGYVGLAAIACWGVLFSPIDKQ